MKVFLGSSTERLLELETIAKWIRTWGFEAIPWNQPGVFPVGQYTYETLNLLKDQIDAAVFVFSEDDKIWYRSDTKLAPRDNVLVEYGLLSGSLEPTRVAICKLGDIKMPSDLSGVTYVDLSDLGRAETDLQHWLARAAKYPPLTGRARIMAFQNKFSMPSTNDFWASLYLNAQGYFALMGSSNKSWILRSNDRRRTLAEAIVRIVEGGGTVDILCNPAEDTLDNHAKFIKEHIVSYANSLPKRAKSRFLAALIEQLRISASDRMTYQAVMSDERIVVMPLLNSFEFKEESLVFEMSPQRHGELYSAYSSDISRTLEKYRMPSFLEDRCLK